MVILPTGGGKSLLFMAPAYLENPGVSIVVIPFRELINNIKSRLWNAGI
jgi:superfamily II DNA helicase RecQ